MLSRQFAFVRGLFFGREGGGLYRPVAKRVLLFAHDRLHPQKGGQGKQRGDRTPDGPHFQGSRRSNLFGLGLPGAQSPFHGISQLPQRLPILHRQLYNECILIPLPYIACDATSQPITIVIYLYKRNTAAVAATGHDSVTAMINVYLTNRVPKMSSVR